MKRRLFILIFAFLCSLCSSSQILYYTSKTYSLAANTTYFISIAGGLSYICYEFSVVSTQFLTKSMSNGVQQEVTKFPNSSSEFRVLAYPNPSGSYFNLKIAAGNNEKINIRVLDAAGRLIEAKKDLAADDIIRMGERYINGVYMVEVTQGKNRRTLKLVKM